MDATGAFSAFTSNVAATYPSTKDLVPYCGCCCLLCSFHVDPHCTDNASSILMCSGPFVSLQLACCQPSRAASSTGVCCAQELELVSMSTPIQLQALCCCHDMRGQCPAQCCHKPGPRSSLFGIKTTASTATSGEEEEAGGESPYISSASTNITSSTSSIVHTHHHQQRCYETYLASRRVPCLVNILGLTLAYDWKAANYCCRNIGSMEHHYTPVKTICPCTSSSTSAAAPGLTDRRSTSSSVAAAAAGAVATGE